MKLSHRSQALHQSKIRAASVECSKRGGINLGQGICDIPTPDGIKQGVMTALAENKTIYSACEGVYKLREAIAHKFATFNHIKVNPEDQVLVTHGSTGAFICATMTMFDPGDEVILFEPFYGYHRNILNLYDVVVKAVPMSLSDFLIDWDQLKQAITPKTRAIVVCTPCNPNGKVFSHDELSQIGQLARQHDLFVITDEIYEYMTYPGYEHISLASLEDFANRTITISGFSKTYNMTGWRLGYVAGPAEVIKKMALVQDLVYVCPPTPLQYAAIEAFNLQPEYYTQMSQQYLTKRDLVVNALRDMGFAVTSPQGAYYLMVDFTKLGFADDVAATEFILEKANVAVVPGRAFYLHPESGKHLFRLCYSLSMTEVERALVQMKESVG